MERLRCSSSARSSSSSRGRVVAEVVVVVASVVLVLVVGGEHIDVNVTDADAAAWKPSDQTACRDNVMSPVSAPGTIVRAEVLALLATSE